MCSLLCLAPPTLPAVTPVNRDFRYNVRIWQTDDGLPQNSVWAIAQTSDGYLWVGTKEGLARFDGLRFTTLEEKAAPELKHGWITALCACRDGSLWIAVDGYGVVRLKAGTYLHLSESDGLPSNQTRCLLEAKDGSIWIGGELGLTRFKGGKLTNFNEKNGLGDNSVRSLCEDRQGSIRIATMRGLSCLDKSGAIRTFNVGLGSIGNALRFVCEDHQGRFWLSSNDGVHCLTGEKYSSYGIAEGLPNKVSNIVFEDQAGRLWVGSYTGLARIADGQGIVGPREEAVFDDLIYAIYEDHEGNLWVGGRDGLYRLTPKRFTTYAIEQGLSCNNVMSVCEDNAGSIWLGTWGGGLNELRAGQFRSVTSKNGLSHDMVLSMHQGRDGSFWLGMDFDGGLNRLNHGQRTGISKQDGLLDAAIRVIHEAKDGALWVGTSKGLNIVRANQSENGAATIGPVETYATTNGLAGNTVLVIHEDCQGAIWVGTDGGLSRWTSGKFTSFTTKEGLAHNAVGALYEDADHSLWIGTRGGGLNHFRDGRFYACTTKQGLFNDEIYEILEDDAGCLWMSCRKGVFRVSKRELTELETATRKTVTCTAFGKADGLLSVQCNGVAKPSGWKAKDGRLWFPTIRGVLAVEPRIKTNEQPPPVLIEEVLVDKKPFAGAAGQWAVQPLKIPPGHAELEIQYTALSLQAPEKNRFRYRLQGVDPGWIEAGARRTAFYNIVAPGNYRFQVSACNNDGVWNENGASLALIVLPYYWQTWWFKLTSAAALGIILTALYRARVARLRELERLRIQIASNLHDDVGARLTKVAMVTEWVDLETEETDRRKTHIRTLSRTTREIIQAMDEIVWTINPKNDTLDNLATYIFQYAQEYFQNTGTRCRLDLPAELPECSVSTEDRHNLFMAVKEALNNVLKHARAAEVRITLAAANAMLTITITDNGRGFSTTEPHPLGNGLENMKQRLEQMGGRLSLESQPGKGTTITMETQTG
jgi:ligand-binding sensor domain-containing protein/signal transduction histidine kinase